MYRINNRARKRGEYGKYAEGDGGGHDEYEGTATEDTTADMHENEDSCRIRAWYVRVKRFQGIYMCVNMERGAICTAVCEGVG